MMQGFYWDSPSAENVPGAWWPRVQKEIANLAKVGFTAIWLPPPQKGYDVVSTNGAYQPYDYWDLGEFDQKGGIPTYYGTTASLQNLIGQIHAGGMQALADLVIQHNSGADAQELNPISGQQGWTVFNPKSGQFPRNWQCFVPSPFDPTNPVDPGDPTYNGMPILSHHNPDVSAAVLALARWLIEKIGFDGFRYDMVVGFQPWVIEGIQEYQYDKNGAAFAIYGVGEDWSQLQTIEQWTSAANYESNNPVNAFDFPLRSILLNVCDTYGYSLTNLAAGNAFYNAEPMRAVTFVDNHDTDHSNEMIVNDKQLAYGVILTHEGYPCVFWKDYFVYGLAASGTPNGIDALVAAHETYAGGGTQSLWTDDNLYAIQRLGYGSQKGLAFVLNNLGDAWNGQWMTTTWSNVQLQPVAWWSPTDLSRPANQTVADDGRVQLSAPPRGYAVYAPV